MAGKTTISKISFSMTIADIINKHPQIAEVLISYGLHCVGCAVNQFETIEQGAKVHGMSDKKLAEMMDDINLVVTKQPSYPTNPDGITLSPRAVKALKKIIRVDHSGEAGLKVAAKKIEGELDYFLDLVKDPDKNDIVLEWKGIKLFTDQDSLSLMKPSIVDYLKTEAGEGFRVIAM